MSILKANYNMCKGPVAGENKRKPLRLESSETPRESDTREEWQLGKDSASLSTVL